MRLLGRTYSAKINHGGDGGGGGGNGNKLSKLTPSPPHGIHVQYNDPISGANVILPNPLIETIIKMTQH